jgi:hypothetical protein
MGGNGAANLGAGVGGTMGNILVPEYTIMGLADVLTKSTATIRHTCNNNMFMSKLRLLNVI